MKKIIKISVMTLLMVLTSVSLVACGGTGDDEVLTDNALQFVESVEDIGEVTLQSRDKLTISSRLYNYLNAVEVAFKKVKDSKATLDVKQGQYDKLVEDNLSSEDYEKEKVRIEAFIAQVNKLPSPNNVTKLDRSGVEYAELLYSAISSDFQSYHTVLEAYNKLELIKNAVDKLCAEDDLASFNSDLNKLNNVNLNNAVEVALLTAKFNNLSDSVKELSGYKAAETKYFEIYNKYYELKNNYDIGVFLDYVEKLDVVTLGSYETINFANLKYNEMTTEAKEDIRVVEGKLIVDNALKTYNELYAADQAYKVETFLGLVEQLPEVDLIGKSDFNTLYDIKVVYSSLSVSSQFLSEVRASYSIYKLAQEKFDSYGYEQINTEVIDLTLTSNSLRITNYRTVYAKIVSNHFDGTATDYATVSSVLIEKQIALTVYVYNGDSSEIIGSFEIDYATLNSTQGFILQRTNLTQALETLSLTNDRIVSGGNYSFSANFVDKTGELLPSTICYQTDSTNELVWG